MTNNAVSFDSWMSGIFGYPVYKLAMSDELAPEVNRLGKGALHEDIWSGRAFFYSKCGPASISSIQALHRLGFILVDANTVFEKRIIRSSGARQKTNPFQIRLAQPSDQEQVVALAGRSFSYSRFHLDPLIPNALADTVKKEWVRNFFIGKRGDYLVVAICNGVVAGFAQLLAGSDQSLTIDLIAVSPETRRMGIAAAMIEFVENEIASYDAIRVGTQIANVPSTRLYEKIGFRFTGASYVFHMHQE
jgi:ribosomal protein S18 acetylase RimI-like enzyme